MAKFLFRQGIGYEINSEFDSIIQEKIQLDPFIVQPDFLIFAKWLYENQDSGQYRLNFEFSKQKSIFAIDTTNGLKFVVDLMVFSTKDFENQQYLVKLKSKLQENNIINFIEQVNRWSEIQRFILFLSYPKEFSPEIDAFINENSYQNVEICSFEKSQHSIESLFYK
jgi:hypothetical protein